MASFPDKAWCLGVHQRLLAGDPTASAQLYESLYSPLVGWLVAKARTRDHELTHDAATDALIDYIKHPVKWNSDRGTLVSYLCMAADRDLLNALEKVARLQKKEISIADVEEQEFGGNVTTANEDLDSLRRFLPMLERELKSETDRQVVALMAQGERSTNKFAQVLKVQHKTKLEQAREVKQHKDRLKKVIERLRKRIDGAR